MDKDGNKSPTTLTEYVKLSLFSTDQHWQSRAVRAIIAPNLCAPVILGLPFLEVNCIVVDHELRTCIDKTSKYDLLNPVLPPPPPGPKLKLRKHIEFTKEANKLVQAELKWVLTECNRILEEKHLFEDVKPFDIVAAVRDRVEVLANWDTLIQKEAALKEEFKSIFEPIPHASELPSEVLAEIKIKDASKMFATRAYKCPRRYRDSWAILLQKHLDAGRIQPSSSPCASPAFIIPKADPTALSRWVNDYRQLNTNTVIDSHPLPRVDDILSDCAKGKIWATIDMTDLFFQTRMHPDAVPYTAVSTPFGLYKWLVMPMGLRNAPSIHQRRVTAALRMFIGKICHIYLDDIVIWSQSVEEHKRNVHSILQALRDAKIYMNPKKTELFCFEIDFLGHHISARGIEADSKKTDCIEKWPIPKSATEVKRFLGLVHYIADFLPNLAEHTRILTPLTTKEAQKSFPTWTDEHQAAFVAIKGTVISRDCLTTIDHSRLDTHKIFLTTDASDFRSGAILSFGTSWETA